MTSEQKKQVITCRLKGERFKDIANRLNVPVSTVSSYCYNHPELLTAAKANQPDGPVCAQCGAQLPKSKFRPRRFCSDKCRSKYWSVNAPYAVGRQAMVQCTCQRCGKLFRDYAKRSRKYCSQACYLADRYGGKQDDQ